MADLKNRDPYYQSFRDTLDELYQLREAHGTLISMIKTNHVQVDESLTTEMSMMVDTEADIQGSSSKMAFGPNPYLENEIEMRN